MALQNPDHTITVKMGAKEYTLDTKKMPYFEAWSRSKLASGCDATALTHDEIENFDVALTCVQKGFRNCFRLLGTDLNRYYALCKTLDYLLVDVLGGWTLKEVSKDFRTIKSGWSGYYDDDEPRTPTTKGAKDSAFRFLYMLHANKFEARDSSKVFESTLFIVSHRGSFKHNSRSVIREAYCQKFSPTLKQRAKLDEWPVYVGEKPFDSDEDYTTPSSDDYTDSDDYCYWSSD